MDCVKKIKKLIWCANSRVNCCSVEHFLHCSWQSSWHSCNFCVLEVGDSADAHNSTGCPVTVWPVCICAHTLSACIFDLVACMVIHISHICVLQVWWGGPRAAVTS